MVTIVKHEWHQVDSQFAYELTKDVLEEIYPDMDEDELADSENSNNLITNQNLADPTIGNVQQPATPQLGGAKNNNNMSNADLNAFLANLNKQEGKIGRAHV